MTKRQRQILTMLSDCRQWREDEIKSSFHFLQRMWLFGWLDGAFIKNWGNAPNDRIWWITRKGREALAAKQ